MPEISLNILDVAENSTRADASLVQITVDVQPDADRLTVIITDDGCGMTKEQVERVTDPFYTSRTTRKVGLGVPFFKFAAESTGGSFSIESEPGKGTTVTAIFTLNHIDRMPLGDKEFSLDTREMRAILGDVPFDTPEISSYIKDYLTENKLETDGGTVY